MKPMKILFWLLVMMILLGGATSSAVFAPITLTPDSSASKVCILGYRAHCSFAPISTIILVTLALAFGYGSLKLWTRKPFKMSFLVGEE